MKYILAKFKHRCSDKVSIANLLHIEAEKVEEHPVDSFFSQEFYSLARKAEREKAVLVGINYPLDSELDIEVVKNFVKECANSTNKNTYYYPRPNKYAQVDDFALFAISSDWSLDNFLIELLFRDAKIDRVSRNKAHPFIRGMNGVTTKHYFGPKTLFNLSSSWLEWKPSEEVLRRDLIERSNVFYPAPDTIVISPTNTCNLSCVMCTYHSPIYKAHHTSGFFDTKKMLSDEVMYKILDYAVKHNCGISFGGCCEPLMYPKLSQYISDCKKSGVKWTSIITNATLLNENTAKNLLDAGLDNIEISVDAANPETYKAIRGANLEKTEKNVENFLNMAKNYPIKVALSFILQSDAKTETDAFFEKWSAHKDAVDSIIFTSLSEYDFESGASKVVDASLECKDRFVCARPWNRAFVYPDGGFNVCCQMGGQLGWDFISFGNLYEQSLEEIWSAPRLMELRGENLSMEFKCFGICENCTEWSLSYVEESDSQLSNTEVKVVSL